MDSNQLGLLLNHDSNFLGVFASDDLPKLIPSIFSLIVNTDPSHKSGTHWIAIIVNHDYAFYFDSFGGPPRVKSIKLFCNKFPIVDYNRDKHQNVNEETCGAYCVFVINEMAHGRSFKSILGTLERIKRDDLYVRKYLIEHFSFHL